MTVRKLLSVLRQHGGEMTFEELRKVNSYYHRAALDAVERKYVEWRVYANGTGGMELAKPKGKK